jgi:tRNA-dihydrouridine synthase B
LQESGADGLMIGRGCYGRPWFVRQVIEWLKTRRRVSDPPLTAQLEIVLDHYEEMLLHYGAEVGSRIARKHIAWYSKGLPGSAEFRAAVNETVDAECVRRLIRSFYEPLLARETA